MIPKNLLLKNKKKSLVIKGKKGTAIRPRISVFKSNRFIYAQLIDDIQGKTILAVSEKDLTENELKAAKPLDIATLLGQKLAEKAIKLNIKSAIFDRHNFQYHGRVKNIAEGARLGGLKI